jgi:TPR repeat protein
MPSQSIPYVLGAVKSIRTYTLKPLRSLVTAISLLIGSVSAVTAQDWLKAYEAPLFWDFQAASQEWRLLAEQGYAAAQYNLGFMYDNGEGVLHDYAEAVKWYRLAAEQGYADAQYKLGVMYQIGKGVPQDDAEAVKWYRLAAEQGYADAQYKLGVMYTDSRGVLQSNAIAHMWFNMASANGHDEASTMRDYRASVMDNTDISKAQEMARECMNSNYQNCGD